LLYLHKSGISTNRFSILALCTAQPCKEPPYKTTSTGARTEMKKWILIFPVVILAIFILAFDNILTILISYDIKNRKGGNKKMTTEEENDEDFWNIRIGKKLYIFIPEDIVVDASYIDKVNKGEIEHKEPGQLFSMVFFDMINSEECNKLIDYMSNNQLVIEPGTYIINQAWRVDKVIENLRFKKQDVGTENAIR
jgi:hypothetical protein